MLEFLKSSEVIFSALVFLCIRCPLIKKKPPRGQGFRSPSLLPAPQDLHRGLPKDPGRVCGMPEGRSDFLPASVPPLPTSSYPARVSSSSPLCLPPSLRCLLPSPQVAPRGTSAGWYLPLSPHLFERLRAESHGGRQQRWKHESNVVPGPRDRTGQ